MTTFIRCHLPAQETRWAALLGVFPVAVIHGLSNTFLHHGQVDSAGSLEFWAAFTFVVVYCVRRRMQELEDELDDYKTTWWPDWDRR